MQKNKEEEYAYQEDEISLRDLVNSLIARKFLIIGFTGFVTISAFLYTNTMVPKFQATSSFMSPSNSSVVNLNRLFYTTETKKSIFSTFLNQLISRELQAQVFVENDFIAKFNIDNKPIDNIDEFIFKSVSSVKIILPELDMKYNLLGFLTELPYKVQIEGENAKAISEYLDTLVAQADSRNIMEIIQLNQEKISIRLDQISMESEILIEKAKQERLNQIEIIKEQDSQQVRQINDEIARLRYKAKEELLNEIVVLTDAAKLAKSLGIIENNFKLINDNNSKSSDLTISIGESSEYPEWYLYGEKALLQRIELLDNRTSNDSFIPQLIILKNQLNEIENNNLFKTLLTRQTDNPFIPELITLNMEEKQLKSKHFKLEETKSINLVEIAQIENISTGKRMIILVAFFISLMLSIILALFMSPLKRDEKNPA